MRFKKGDIVECPYDGSTDKVVVKLTSDARLDHYMQPWGTMSVHKSWWASGIHIAGPYKGVIVHTFHVGGCSLVGTFGLKRSIKKLWFNKKL
jgi:hypothetical protein